MTKDFFLQHLPLHGIAAHTFEDAPFIYGAISTGGQRTLLLYFQCNTLHNTDEAHHSYLDILTSLYTYYNTASTPLLNLKWLIQTANTVDDAELDRMIAQHSTLLQADACIAIHATSPHENGPLLALGAKGLLSAELSVTMETPQPLPTSYGAIAPNAAWRLTWALNSLKDAREDILIDGFYDMVLSAGDDETTLLHTLPDTILMNHWQTKNVLPGLASFQLHYAHLLTPTCTITSISAGNPTAPPDEQALTMPTHATAHIDMHLVPEQDPHAIFQQLQQHLQAQGLQDVQARILTASRPFHITLAHPFVQLVQRATASAYGREPITLPLLPYSLALAPLQRRLALPVMIVPMGRHQQEQAVTVQVKQIALIIEGRW